MCWDILVKLKLRRVIDMTIDEAEKIKTIVENKDYIVQLVNTVAKNMIEAFENLKIEDVNMFQLGYNKAIDDFIHECDKYCGFYSGKNKNIIREDILKIAEQLKAVGENESK